jgi:hypothetical protein
VRLFALTFCSVGVGVSHAGDYRMSLSSIILGHDGKRLPFDIDIIYANGTEGTLHVYAHDMRECLTTAAYWLPLHLPARSVLITERRKS